jgi:hypothetical protein
MAGYIGTKAVALSTTTGNILGDMTVGGTTDVATLEFNSLSGTGAVTITDILDEDNLASNSATKLATQQSIKAYVDSQVDTVDTLAEILAVGNRTSGAGKIEFRDAAIYLNSSADGQLDIVADTEIQIAATTVDLNGNLDVSGTALVTGVLTTTAATVHTNGITMPDSAKAIFGAGSDLEIYHDGSNSYIQTIDSASGDLFIDSNGTGHDLYLRATDDIFIQPQINENGITVVGNGAVTLYHDNEAKLATTNTGTTTTGVSVATGFSGKIYSTTGNTNYFFQLKDTNEFNFFNANGASDTIHINYDGGNVDLAQSSLIARHGSGVTIANGLSLTDGNLVVAAGHGIDFASTGGPTNGSGSSELLNDYEEGTWTPVDIDATVGFTVYTALYTKVGRTVNFECGIELAATSRSNDFRIAGLPFTVKNGADNTGGAGVPVGTNSGRSDLFLCNRNTTILGCGTNLNVNVAISAYSGKQLKLNGWYVTDS